MSYIILNFLVKYGLTCHLCHQRWLVVGLLHFQQVREGGMLVSLQFLYCLLLIALFILFSAFVSLFISCPFFPLSPGEDDP